MERRPGKPKQPQQERRFGAKHFIAVFVALGGIAGIIEHLRGKGDERPGIEAFDTGPQQNEDEKRKVVHMKRGKSLDGSLEHDNLPPDEQERADEHADIKHAAADQLSKVLPEGFSINWTVAVIPEGGAEQPQYNDNLQITGPDGHFYGDVFPFEDGMHFIPDDNLSDFYRQMTGSQLGAFDFTDPADINNALGDVESLEDYRDEWKEFQNNWPDNDKFNTDEDGVMTLNPDYESQMQTLEQNMRNNLKGLDVTTTDVQQDRAEEEEAARQEALEEENDTGF